MFLTIKTSENFLNFLPDSFGGLELVLIHTKKLCLASYYIHFSTNIKMYNNKYLLTRRFPERHTDRHTCYTFRMKINIKLPKITNTKFFLYHLFSYNIRTPATILKSRHLLVSLTSLLNLIATIISK